ncbi:serine/threonine-protein kinase STY46-like [Syzygium oleosum]|uniref:serine/threonine-protein kinase STY46-like n=1 Tax=Syzygium oleosum TaxID=219896 RepID=UPI0024B9AFF5|nr:serine/threonine-protein kinase STY46-like [Syzygium oleosum]
MAQNPATRPAIEVRLGQVPSLSSDSCGDSVHSTSPRNVDAHFFCYKRRQSIHPLPDFGLSPKMEVEFEGTDLPTQNWDRPTSGSQHSVIRTMHEVTISTNDRRKFLSQLTSLMSEIGLNIQEAHAFSTTDGYSLDVFAVDGWERETEELKEILKEKMLKIEKHPQLKCNGSSDTDKQKQNGIKSNHNHVNVSSEGKDVWEIDVNMLSFEKKIASGSYAELYKGMFLSQDVAIKLLRTEHLNKTMQQEFAQEVYIMRKIRHKNIVQFIGACTRPPRLCIVTEYMSGGSLFDFLHKQNDVLKLSTVLRLAIDVSKGMNYLHKNNIIHRDLKAANLLMDENEVVKIADFGVARVQTQSGVMTAETGTYRWMAPEVIEHRPYDHKADVFSFGIVLWELLTGKLPYEDVTPLQAAIGVVHKGLRPTIPEHTHPDLEKLLNECWEREPSLRPEFSEIVEILQQIAKTAQD